MIAGKRSSRGISAVFARRQPDDEQARMLEAKGFYRSTVVIGIIGFDSIKKQAKPWTQMAIRIENIRGK